MREVFWIGSSKDDLSSMPVLIKDSFGHRLRKVQEGKTPDDMKAMPQFGHGVYELRETFDRNTFSADVYRESA